MQEILRKGLRLLTQGLRRVVQKLFTVTIAISGVNLANACPQPRKRGAKYFKQAMLLASKDEAGGTLTPV